MSKLRVSKQILLEKNEPLDSKTRIENISKLHDITYPYLGLVFYVTDVEKFYKVKTFRNAYLFTADGLVKTEPNGLINIDYIVLENYYINEFEEVILSKDEFSKKVDKIENKDLSSNDYTDAEKVKVGKIKIDGSVDKYLNEQGDYKQIIIPDKNIVNITSQESVVGTYTLDGNYLPVYSTTFKLDNLPKVKDETKEYTLKNEPLGYGMFFNVNKLSVSSGKGIFGEYYNDNYKISKIYVDNDLKTKIIIKCTDTVVSANNLNMTISLEYLKYDGNAVEFSVELPTGVSADAVSLEFPKLKFNKKFAFSYITDDSNSIYQFIFSGINKRHVATTMSFYYHLNFPKSPDFTEGFTPEYPLEFTDGVGNKRRFATSVAVWPDKLFDQYASGNNVGKHYPWMSSNEFLMYKDFGYSVLYHDLNNYDGTTVNQDNFNKWFTETKNKFLLYINDSPKILAEPNGDHRYLTLTQSVSDIMMNTAQSGNPLIKKVYPHKSDFTLDKSQVAVERFFAGASDYPEQIFNLLKTYNDATDLNTIQWLIGSAHRSSVWEYDLFKRINDNFGARGNDKILFATVDEIFEYWYLTKNATVTKTVTGNTVNFKVYTPKMPRFWFNEISCLLNGVTSINGVTVNSNTNGLSYGISDNKLLVNLNFNDNLITKAEKYVSKFESSPNADYVYDDALYMVNQLKPSLRTPFLNRLNTLTSPPTLTSVVVNNGVATTENTLINISMGFTSITPTHYMISENNQFTGSNWITYQSSITYTLSSVYGVKSIFIKLKNNYGESNVVSSQIELKKPLLVLTSITMDSKISTSSANITLNYTGLPTHYRVSPVNDFTNVNWQTFTSNVISYQIPEPYGMKSVYVQLYDSDESKTSSVASGNFEYINTVSAVLESVIINNGDSETGNGNVTIKMNVVNAITHYRIAKTTSELSSATYIPYTTNTVTYNSGVTSGNLIVYVQVKNTVNESEVKSDSISVVLPVTLTSLIIANDSDTFVGYNPQVLFNVGQGVPTHYRLSETSNGLNTATWLAWNGNITYTFSTLGSKILYGEVKNNVSTSSVASDTITLTEPPVSIVLGFNALANNTNTKVVTNSITTNQINLSTYVGYTAQQLVNTSGVNVNGCFMNLQSDFYLPNSQFSGVFTGNPSNGNATIASGIYSLSTMAKSYTASQPGAENLGRKARVSFTLPVGTYTMRILWNTGSTNYILSTDSNRAQCFYGIFQGNTELTRTICSNTVGFTPLGNQDFNAEMTFTITDASIPVDLGAWSTTLNNRPGFNLIEIRKTS